MPNLITEARELCENVTHGQWKRHDTANYAEIHNGDTWGKDLSPIALVGHTDDANFIARSRTLIPELCDALEKAQERGQGCEHCRGWDKRCGANYCPMCGRELEEHHEAD